jgi:hypothetical protein
MVGRATPRTEMSTATSRVGSANAARARSERRAPEWVWARFSGSVWGWLWAVMEDSWVGVGSPLRRTPATVFDKLAPEICWRAATGASDGVW